MCGADRTRNGNSDLGVGVGHECGWPVPGRRSRANRHGPRAFMLHLQNSENGLQRVRALTTVYLCVFSPHIFAFRAGARDREVNRFSPMVREYRKKDWTIKALTTVSYKIGIPSTAPCMLRRPTPRENAINENVYGKWNALAQTPDPEAQAEAESWTLHFPIGDRTQYSSTVKGVSDRSVTA